MGKKLIKVGPYSSKEEEKKATINVDTAKDVMSQKEFQEIKEKILKREEVFKPTTFTSIDLDMAITKFYDETKGGKAVALVSSDNLKIDLKRILAEMESKSQ